MNNVILNCYQLVYDITISNITQVIQLFDMGFCIHLHYKDIVILDILTF